MSETNTEQKRERTPGPCQVRDFDGDQILVIGPSSEGPAVLLAVCTGEERYGNAELFAASPLLLKASRATMDYWTACAASAADGDEEANHPGCHVSIDTPELQALCNKAAELTAAAIAAASPQPSVTEEPHS